jgi:hypothetical protein
VTGWLLDYRGAVHRGGAARDPAQSRGFLSIFQYVLGAAAARCPHADRKWPGLYGILLGAMGAGAAAGALDMPWLRAKFGPEPRYTFHRRECRAPTLMPRFVMSGPRFWRGRDSCFISTALCSAETITSLMTRWANRADSAMAGPMSGIDGFGRGANPAILLAANSSAS